MPKNPYTALLQDIKAFCRRAASPKRRMFCWFKHESVADGQGIRMDRVEHQVRAGAMLGYDTVVESTERGLEFIFVEKRLEAPFNW